MHGNIGVGVGGVGGWQLLKFLLNLIAVKSTQCILCGDGPESKFARYPAILKTGFRISFQINGTNDMTSDSDIDI